MQFTTNSKHVLSDSGSITEESSIMGFNAINLRSTNERQEGFQYGVVPMVHLLFDKINKILTSTTKPKKLIEDYKCEWIFDIFLNLLLSYTNYVNNMNSVKLRKLKILFCHDFWPENFRINELVERYDEKAQYYSDIQLKLIQILRFLKNLNGTKEFIL